MYWFTFWSDSFIIRAGQSLISCFSPLDDFRRLLIILLTLAVPYFSLKKLYSSEPFSIKVGIFYHVCSVLCGNLEELQRLLKVG